MRTTVTIDDDAERLLRQAMRQTGESFKATLNRAIRRGLVDTVPVADEKPFVVESQPMGLRPGIDPTKLQDLADEMEVAGFLKLSRRLDRESENGGTSQ